MMDSLTRRGFVESLGAAAGLSRLPMPEAPDAPLDDKTVRLSGDGNGQSPAAFAALLQRLTAARDVGEDSYLLGGEVAAFERHWAALLGKEAAVFMPSGTLANHLALRALAGTRRRVIVPEMSHICNDTGDVPDAVGLTLMPLAPRAATFDRRCGKRS
jgi:threonine aldolase